jgi:hypothetical protein
MPGFVNTVMNLWIPKIGDFIDQFSNYQLSETSCTADLEWSSYLRMTKACWLDRKSAILIRAVSPPVGGACEMLMSRD